MHKLKYIFEIIATHSSSDFWYQMGKWSAIIPNRYDILIKNNCLTSWWTNIQWFFQENTELTFRKFVLRAISALSNSGTHCVFDREVINIILNRIQAFFILSYHHFTNFIYFLFKPYNYWISQWVFNLSRFITNGICTFQFGVKQI